jgi:hypothetical protein
MSPELQRIAIAKACGLTILSDGIMHHLTPCGKKTERDPEGCLLKECPNYLSDLNAMHEAEGSVIFADSALSEEYGMRLGKSYHPRWFLEITSSQLAAMCHATAAQRAEAFLRTLNLWEES